jgi:hypothetical protein
MAATNRFAYWTVVTVTSIGTGIGGAAVTWLVLPLLDGPSEDITGFGRVMLFIDCLMVGTLGLVGGGFLGGKLAKELFHTWSASRADHSDRSAIQVRKSNYDSTDPT